MGKDHVKKINLSGAMKGHWAVAWKPHWEGEYSISPLTPTP